MNEKKSYTSAIAIQHISKKYADTNVIALDDISFNVQQGELFGLIGPDGAGKTSLFRILTTLILADKGQASITGFDVVKDYQAIRRSIGYMPGRFSLYQDLTVHENLTFFATLFGTTIEENYELVKDIYEQIKPFSNRRAGKLSGGMKQKLALCCALIHKPTVLFLDEPTTGVDVVSRREFWEMLKNLKKQNITILVSTPYMDEANLCERIALIQSGKILGINTPENILQQYPTQLYAAKSGNIYTLLIDLRNHPDIETCFPFGEWLHITLKKGSMQDIEKYALLKGHKNFVINPTMPNIEDSFIRLMNQNTEPTTH